MMKPLMWTSAALLALRFTLPAPAPNQLTLPRLTFEVASIHPAKPGTANGMIKGTPGGAGYLSRNIPVKLMISLMYRVPMRQISGGPDWLASDGYDVDARADRPYSLDDLHTMFQNLLADRFNLKFHKEVREGNVYALAVDKSGLKMKVNDSPQNYDIPITFGPDGVIGRRVPMPYFCWFLGGQLQRDERPVIDRTNLDGPAKFYDFNLSFAPPLPPDAPKDLPGQDRPSLFDALRQQLGLTLTPQRGPVEYIVIDHIDRPTEN